MTSSGLPLSVTASLQNSKAEYRRLGSSGLHVSVSIMGCMSIGNRELADWVIDAEKALPLLKAAYDRGLKQWDTASVYSNGDSERTIGRAIKEYEIPRQKLVLMAKAWGVTGEEQFAAYPIMDELRKNKDYFNQFELSRISLINAVEGALARLGTTYIDLFWFHRFDPYIHIEETMETLHNFVVAGKIRYIGASSKWTY
ncbi:unnamed protein product [Clonostachys chloroleuca]|uniref:NADP-dependent oxidoreductase domain-containing protein n=1 Tax=Clonostachys chloroleuca TaxID=1926264 RepID=A0AA35LR31_9HYPO|nr:unnamed protein product [Clonostachys chloroleuca]